MTIIRIDGSIPTGLRAFEGYQVYNCLDAGITAQLLEPMRREMNNNHADTYARRMRTQALCLEMSSKGLPVDNMAMLQLVKELEANEAKAEGHLAAFCRAVNTPPINPRSPDQVARLFYEHLGIPTIWKYDHKTKQRKRDTSRNALEKLREQRPIAAPFVNAILAARDARKLASVFKRGLEPGYPPLLRCNFSPSGTETGRLSSQSNPYRRGTNAQNLTERCRTVIAAPPGYAVVYVDLKTAESYGVGFLSRDRAYIEACSSGDLHTAAAKMVWPTELAWTGDLSRDKELAELPFYRHFSYRDMSKRGGHATNYYGQPPTVASHLKVPKELIEAFQLAYFGAFPGIYTWQLDVIAEVQQFGVLTNPLGSQRRFWGRPNDPATHREAIAHLPQSLIAEVMNEGLIQVMRWVRQNRFEKIIDLRAQIHDAGFFLVPIKELSWVIPEITRRIVVPVEFPGVGTMRIPADASVGKNWGKSKFDKKKGEWKNPLGLRDWKPGGALHFDT